MPGNVFKRLIRRFVLPEPVIPVDDRGRRFVAVIDCALNQNTRDAGAARFPAMNGELLRLCQEHEVAILQMPCPEIAALGIKRARAPGMSIRAAMDTENGQKHCAELAMDVADRIAACRADGGVCIGVLGGNPASPGCAVHQDDSGLTGESGVFMLALQAEFRRRQWPVVFKAVRDSDPDLLAADLRDVRLLLGR